MGSFREEMRLARLDLHDAMSFTALYFDGDAPDEAIPVTIRLHEKWLALGDLKGTNFNYAEHSDISPQIIFLLSEVPEPKRDWIVSVSPGVAFTIDTVERPDPPTVTAKVVFLSPRKAEGFPVP